MASRFLLCAMVCTLAAGALSACVSASESELVSTNPNVLSADSLTGESVTAQDGNTPVTPTQDANGPFYGDVAEHPFTLKSAIYAVWAAGDVHVLLSNAPDLCERMGVAWALQANETLVQIALVDNIPSDDALAAEYEAYVTGGSGSGGFYDPNRYAYATVMGANTGALVSDFNNISIGYSDQLRQRRGFNRAPEAVLSGGTGATLSFSGISYALIGSVDLLGVLQDGSQTVQAAIGLSVPGNAGANADFTGSVALRPCGYAAQQP